MGGGILRWPDIFARGRYVNASPNSELIKQ